jgi:hypothetical protein
VREAGQLQVYTAAHAFEGKSFKYDSRAINLLFCFVFSSFSRFFKHSVPGLLSSRVRGLEAKIGETAVTGFVEGQTGIPFLGAE